MSEYTVYSKEGCPKCKVLKLKMEQKGMQYQECQDLDDLIKLGFTSLPVLRTMGGQLMTFEEAVKFVNER